jgi:hypothetical protein
VVRENDQVIRRGRYERRGIMTGSVRWVVVAVLAGHGLIHLLGAVKGFGWAEVSQLKQPIGPGGGLVWLLAAVLVLASAVLIAAGAPTWRWAVAVLAAMVSEVAIATAWSDAKFGTAANLILLLAAGYGFASLGPASFHAQFRDRAVEAAAGAHAASTALVTEADLADLPKPLADYVRRSGAVGRPRVTSFSAQFHGRIRSGPDQSWMPFTGEQFNTYGPHPQRVFIMDATRSGLPVTVLHSFKDTTATMRAKVLSVFTVVNASGPEMDRGETVTVFNDLVVLAPGAIVDAPVRWTAVDAHHVRGVFTDGDQTVSAELTFDANHDLVDFVSADRLRASTDVKSFEPQVWSTPLAEHRDADGRRILVMGEGRWHAPEPEGLFTYVEFHTDDITYNLGRTDATPAPAHDVPAKVSP